jgi:hypothetical protein
MKPVLPYRSISNQIRSRLHQGIQYSTAARKHSRDRCNIARLNKGRVRRTRARKHMHEFCSVGIWHSWGCAMAYAMVAAPMVRREHRRKPRFHWAAAVALLFVCSSCCSAFYHSLPDGTSVRAGYRHGSSRGARCLRSRGSDEEDPPYMGLG